jgi:hypothetical protein
MDVVAKSMRSRFPLYSDYVDKVVERQTGNIPTNALREALRREATAGAVETDAQRLQKLEDKMINDGTIPSDYFVRQGQNPYTLTELQKEQARVQSKEFNTESRQRQIELNKSQDAENKQFNADTANQEVWNKVETATRPMIASIQQTTQSIYGGLAQGQEPSPQDQQEIVAAFGQFKASVLSQFDLTMKEPHGESGWTYNQSLKPEDRTKLENGIKNYLEVQEDALTHNRTGILDATKTHLEAIQTGDATQILESDDFARLLSANSKLFGPEVNNQLMLQTKGAGLDNQASFINKELTLKLSNEGANAPLSEHFKAEIEKGHTDPKGYWSAISDRYNQITDPKLPTNVRYNQVMGMFSTDPFQYFIDKGDDSLATQRTLYSRFATPEFATQVKAIAADGHPDALQAYSKWAYEKAALLNRTAIHDAKDVTTSRPNMRLSFDPDSHQLMLDEGTGGDVYSPAGKAPALITGFSALLEKTLMEPAARKSVDQINQAIRGMIPVIEANGIKDVNKELIGFFQASGLDLTQEDTGFHENAVMTMYDSVREAFRNFAKTYSTNASGGASSKTPFDVNFNAAVKDMKLNTEEQSLYRRHLTNLYGSGGVTNTDKSRSTLLQHTVEYDGKFYNIPSVWDGKILTGDVLKKKIQEVGITHFPSYKTEAEAEARYQLMHQYMEKDTQSYFNQGGQ